MSIQSIGAAGASGIDPKWIAQGRDRGDDRDGGRFASAIAAAGKAMGLDADKVAALQQDLAKAVAGVGASVGGSQAPGDRRATIAAAIDTALKNDGVDPQQFHAQLAKQLHGKHGHHHHRAPDQAAAAPPSDAAARVSPASDAPVSPAGSALLDRLV